MPTDLSYLEGRRFCVVFARFKDEGDPEASPIQMRALRGRANVDRQGYVHVEGDHGTFRVPPSAYPHILPGDNTEYLQGAEYFVILRVSGMEL